MSQHRNIRLLMLLNFLVDLSFFNVIAILYFAQVTGSFAAGMTIFSIVMLSSALWEVPTGILSDRIGRKRTMIFAAVARTGAIIFYAIGGAFAALAVGGILEGLSRALYSGNNEALLYDTLAERGFQDQYAEYLGKTSSMYHVAGAIGGIVGSLLAFFSFSLVVWLSVIPQILTIVVTLFFYEPPRKHAVEENPFKHLREALQLVRSNPRLRLLTLGNALRGAVGEAAYQFRTAFIETLWPVWAIGIARIVSNLTAALGSYFAGRIIRRFGEYRLLVGGIALSEASIFISLLFPTLLSPVIMASSSLFHGINMTASGTLMQHEFTHEQRATMGSITSFFGSLFFGIAAPIIGAMADAWTPRVALMIAAGVSVTWIYAYARALGTKSKREAVLEGV